MSFVLAVLTTAGRHGPILLCGGVLIGLVAPVLAELARPLMGLAVFAFTLGAFLKVDAAAMRAAMADRRAVLAALGWSSFGVPLLAVILVRLLGPDTEAGLGFLLCMLAPPVGSAAAIAAMLGLNAPLALLATVFATLLAPFTLPPFAASLAGASLAIDPLGLAGRLGLIVGGAGVVTLLLRRWAGCWVDANPQAMTGISVVGLLLVAVGAMRGMRAEILADPAYALALLGLAFLANAGFQLVGALLFAGLARPLALTVGLVSGNRNVTLIWAAATPFLAGHPGVELFLAMSVFPIFILPAPTRWLLRRPAWPARRAGRVAQRAGLVLVLAAALGGLGGRIAAAQAVPEPAGPVELFGTGESAGFLSLPARPAPPGGLGVVVLAADQTGPDYRSLRYIARLNAMGIAALELLAYEPDTVDRPDAVAVILAQALVALSADPRVDPQHLGILAFGAAAAAALPGSAAPGHAPVLAAARAALYPGCAGVLDRLGPPPEVPDATPMGADPDAVGRPKPAHGPLLLLHGTVDPANTPSDCAALARRLGRQGPVERLEYAGASYAWDRPGYGAEGPSSLPRPDGAGRVLTAYWPGLADLSAEQVARFFTRAFGPGW